MGLPPYPLPQAIELYLPCSMQEAMMPCFRFAAVKPCADMLEAAGLDLLTPAEQLLLGADKLHPSSAALTLLDTTTRNNRKLMRDRLHALLWAEEAQARINLLAFSKPDVVIRPAPSGQPDMFVVPAEGVSEKRPSVIRGDEIHVAVHGSEDDGACDEGVVWFVNNDELVCNFSPSSTVARTCRTPGRTFDIEFTDKNRSQWKLQHLAVDEGYFLSRSAASALRKPALVPVNYFTAPQHRSPLNAEQQRFLNMVISRDGAPIHLLHGPPGTGKTTLATATIAELLARYVNARILVACPSNAAADLIVERLSHYRFIGRDARTSPRTMRRFHAMCRNARDVSDIVKRFSDVVDIGDDFVFPARAEYVESFDVVVVTMAVAGALMRLGVRNNAFTHVVCDECCQATESQMMLATAFCSSGQTSLILAGDPRQLGPVITSSPCKEAGMGVSTLERLAFDPHFAPNKVMLVDNYRSHPSVLNIVNASYDDKLVAARQDYERNPVCLQHRFVAAAPRLIPAPRGWKDPVVFIHCDGEESRIEQSPSWQNVEEVRIVTSVIKHLVNTCRISAADIVALTPYRLQRESIEKRLFAMTHHLSELNVTNADAFFRESGKPRCPVQVTTAEAFQGREAKVVIVSCVRSRKVDAISHDIRNDLGFICAPNRVNVALSRAQDLLVVVGNAQLLAAVSVAPEYEHGHAMPQQQPTQRGIWHEVISRCHEMGCIVNANPNARVDWQTELSRASRVSANNSRVAVGGGAAAAAVAASDDDDDDDDDNARLFEGGRMERLE